MVQFPGLVRAILPRHWPLLALACATAAHAAAGDEPARTAGEARWSIALEAVALERSNSVNQILVSTLPGATTTFGMTQSLAGTEVFNSNQFDQGREVGRRLTLGYRLEAGRRLELSWLASPDFRATRTIGPENPGNWYVMRAPGFWQTQDFSYQGMTWATTSNVRSLEANVRLQEAGKFGLLLGLRGLRLNDGLEGSLTPNDRNQPTWKLGSCATDTSSAGIFASIVGMTLTGTAQACAAGGAVDGFPPFWTTTTRNDLLGVQAGVEGTVFTAGGLSLGGVARVGVYGNRATQRAAVSMTKQMYYAETQRTGLAFSGQGAIVAKYAFTRNLTGKLGYEMLWLDRVALAPGQINRTVSVSSPGSVTAAGVNAGSNVLLQGGSIGLEYAF